MSPKTTLATLVIGMLVAVSAASSATALDQDPDGITALITFENSIGDLVLIADDNNEYTASVSIFQQNDGEWEQVSLFATLRVFEDAVDGAQDRVSTGFTSSADGPVDVSFSGDTFAGGLLDVFVTFSALGADPTVPTSHHHVVKNIALESGDHGLADGFDHHSTRVIAL